LVVHDHSALFSASLILVMRNGSARSETHIRGAHTPTHSRQSERKRSLRKPGGETTLVERLRARFGVTKTEAAIAIALVEGLSYGEIAKKLGVSYHTVHTHIKAIHHKAGVSTTGRLTALIRGALNDS
jgi:DNA-binding CsgD family transcriptional regulator